MGKTVARLTLNVVTALVMLLDRANDGMLDELLPNGFQGERAEVAGRRVAVQPADVAQGLLDGVGFRGALAVLDVVALGVPPVGQAQLVDAQVGFRGTFRGMRRQATAGHWL